MRKNMILKIKQVTYNLLLIFVGLCLFGPSLEAQTASPIGIWKTIDDGNGQAKSHVEIYQQGSKLYGKIVQLLQKPADTRCDKCSGAEKDQLVLGMVILKDMRTAGTSWKHGTILDPNSGSTYGCSIWFENNNSTVLKVRGKHWTGLYRTQTWYRIK